MQKKILFVVDNLVMGGVTASLVNLLNNLDYQKYQVDLLVLHYYNDVNAQIPSQVSLIKGDKTYKYIDKPLGDIIKNKDIPALFGKLILVFKLKTGLIKGVIKKSRKKLIKKVYDTEIAFNDGFTEIFVANGETKRKIAWLHTDISVFNDSARYINIIRESLSEIDLRVCVSEKVKEAYEECYGASDSEVINNILNVEKIKLSSQEETEIKYQKDKINLVSVGRLCEAKNYPRFVRVHKRLIDAGYNVNSYVVGDGLDRELVEKEIKANGVEDSFKLLGRRENPFPYVKNADLFVLSSNHEGLPTVLYEALILGVPCVSTSVAGASEIVSSEHGIITDVNDDALFCGVETMLKNKKYLEYKEKVAQYEFSIKELVDKIEKVL